MPCRCLILCLCAAQGIQTLLSIRKRFLRSISAINDTLNEAEYLLNNDFNTAYLPNLTANAESQLVNVNYKLTDAETLVSSLNLTDQGGECPCTPHEDYFIIVFDSQSC